MLQKKELNQFVQYMKDVVDVSYYMLIMITN